MPIRKHSTKSNIFYTIRPDYRMVGNRCSQVLFTSENRLCTNLLVQKQSTNMTSQYQYSTFAWRHRSTWWRHNAKSENTGHEIARKKGNGTFITVNNVFRVIREAICQWFSLSKLPHSWPKKSLFRVTPALFFICCALKRLITCTYLACFPYIHKAMDSSLVDTES